MANKMTYKELKNYFTEYNKKPGWANNPIKGVIVFRENNWPDDNYSLESRSYVVSSDNKAFIASMGGYSIFGSSLDGSDKNVRLEQYMEDEYAGKGGWKVDYCYLIEE